MNEIYHVKFAGLNTTFNTRPVAFSIGNLSVRWYGIILCIGFLLAFFYCKKNASRFGVDFDKFFDVIIISSICGIVGARLYYVLFYPGDTYIKEPLKILKLNEGGIAIYGGIIGAIIPGYFLCRLKKIDFKKALDLTSMSFLIGQAVGRWGNFFNQEAFGSKTDLPWGMVSENTFNEYVHPCFLYESLLCIVGFILLHTYVRKAKTFDGEVFALYTIWYSFGRFFIEALRTDSLMLPGINIKVSQLVAAALCVVAIFFISVKKFSKNNV